MIVLCTFLFEATSCSSRLETLLIQLIIDIGIKNEKSIVINASTINDSFQSTSV